MLLLFKTDDDCCCCCPCDTAPPLLLWGAWGAYTYARYGFVHFLGSTDVVINVELIRYSAMPEPTALALAGLGAIAGLAIRRRTR